MNICDGDELAVMQDDSVQKQPEEMTVKMNLIRAAALAGVLAIPMAGTTSAAPPLITGGLVNVTIVDLLDTGDITVVEDVNVSVGAALALAANVCGVGVNVLGTQLGSGAATCDAAIEGGQRVVTIQR